MSHRDYSYRLHYFYLKVSIEFVCVDYGHIWVIQFSAFIYLRHVDTTNKLTYIFTYYMPNIIVVTTNMTYVMITRHLQL